MNLIRKYWLSFIIYLAAFFAAPAIMLGSIDNGFGAVILNLILINSIAVFFVTCYMTYKYGFDWIHLLMMVILYLLSCFIVWNDSAIIYLVLYGIITSAALLLGYLFRRKIRSNG
ncbi:hypothetical protein [Gracilibacillus alcaliphilus]|uniref:hypothetical protein n=1 Tax=Gracilibacillus alcaliphilus TaxID=1401441 RepID=UPI00195EED08|nr:hypothetical protein [Gracilibacillus alcaliphilus]MBM7676787.1 CHASE2 domain-containing sensor protein [Gracilibacillus alcaliphilus]